MTAGAGSITGLFTVLVEGDDLNEPMSDAVRGILDGHIVLDRAIAERGRFPAINILRSVSRAMPGCNSESEQKLVMRARKPLTIYEDMAELIRLGAYKAGTNPEVDNASEALSAARSLSGTKEGRAGDVKRRLCRADGYSGQRGRESGMNRTDTLLRLKRFKVDEMKRRVASIEAMRADLDRKLADLDENVAREKQRAGDFDIGRLAFPSFLRSIETRRENLRATLKEIEREYASAQLDLTNAFQDLKSLELATEQQAKRLAEMQARRQQARLDEMALGSASAQAILRSA